jgi:omega-6 fatty acid desaturase (delta-12 desaturase)
MPPIMFDACADADATARFASPARGNHDSRSLRRMAAGHARPDNRRAAMQLVNTVLPFVGIMAGLLYALDHGVWAALLLAGPGAALLVRLFMIQHDCGHGSFFASRRANDWLGRSIGVLTLTPYASWRKDHAVHHATAGNLSRRGTGDVTTLTVREYLSSPPWRRFAYRLYRHPAVMFGIGPAFQFLVRHRVPTGSPRREGRAWASILGTNAAIVALGGLLARAVGLDALLLGYLPMFLIAASAGVWLFYVQHQFEGTYWADGRRWSFHAAALEGSSYYDLPAPLRWVTANIGFHHLHHLCSMIPNYRLRECFEQHAEFRSAGKRLTLRSSLKAARLSLWDEDHGALVTFRQARRAAAAAFPAAGSAGGVATAASAA